MVYSFVSINIRLTSSMPVASTSLAPISERE